jgi:transmembrane sensor
LHVREFLLAYRMDEKLRRMDPDRQIDIDKLVAGIAPNVLSIHSRVATPPKPRRYTRRQWIAKVAACAAVVAIALVAAQLTMDSDGTYATEVGEQRNFELDDGSVIYLNTGSRLQVRFSQRSRDIYLQEGQALFEVHRDVKRPFRVHAATAVIQAVGTQFDVRRFSDRVAVSVVEGTVQVSSRERAADGDTVHTMPAKIAAGEAATIDVGGKVGPPVHIDTEAATAWRQQQLVFENAPLTQIVSEFNRYNRAPRLRIEGEGVGARQFNGVFNARNPESLLTYLGKNGALVFERRGDEVIIRERPGIARAP